MHTSTGTSLNTNLGALAFPFSGKKILGVTNDSMHFKNIDITREVMIPLLPHLGAFGVTRKFHIHEGVDLYCMHGDPVSCVESGTVRAIIRFTGEHAGTPWWHNTFAVLIEGAHGLINYGEIHPQPDLKRGDQVKTGECIGTVLQVLIKDKGRPQSMLHLELYDPASRKVATWKPGMPRPNYLQDPTPLLLKAAQIDWPIRLPNVQ